MELRGARERRKSMKGTTIAAAVIIGVAVAAFFFVPIKYTAAIGGYMNFMALVISVIVSAVCGMVTRSVMVPKGYGEGASFCVGLFLNLIGVIIACVLPPKDGYAPTTSSESDKAKALGEYKKLLDDGAITPAEYDAKKRELLS
jgi:hypothetical protein